MTLNPFSEEAKALEESRKSLLEAIKQDPVLLDLIRGEKGQDGAHGESGKDGSDGLDVEVDSVVERLKTESGFLESVKGPKGSEGLIGMPGVNGVGISNVEFNTTAEKDTLVVTLDTGEIFTSPNLRGADGEDGLMGLVGPKGYRGAPGAGVVEGGSTGEILAKASGTDYDTEWTDMTSVVQEAIEDFLDVTFVDGVGAEVVYSDVGNSFTFNSVDSEIDHNGLLNYVSDEHHTTAEIEAIVMEVLTNQFLLMGG